MVTNTDLDLGQKLYKYIAVLLMVIILSLLSAVYKTVVDIGKGITHQNHEDTITTPLPGNCPNCDYPDCGGCDGKPQITLMPTNTVQAIPTFGGTPAPATPDIPDPTQFPTPFPTFGVSDLLPTALPGQGVPTIAPTLIAPDHPPSPVPVG